VALGGAAKPLTLDLENEVTELAQGALAAIAKRRAL
jgi:hypothetical protein